MTSRPRSRSRSKDAHGRAPGPADAPAAAAAEATGTAAAARRNAVKVIPRALVEMSWTKLVNWGPDERQMKTQFPRLLKSLYFAEKLHQDDRQRAMVLAKAKAYVKAWDSHAENFLKPFVDSPWSSMFDLHRELLTMQEKLFAMDVNMDRVNAVRDEMEAAATFVTTFTHFDGPHTALFQGVWVVFRDTLVQLDYYIREQEHRAGLGERYSRGE